ncbi:polysaccharide deacetylase [Atopobacter sp. AH10]|uniref:polysaccharide deacetylase family protein n=1 Tax=Atopobacter sp. AH10 TaxID=2315861 RepID=UPI000EF26481|nr:polysaccharide deacetylase family protein [Atopobacter sp. AH10]RLK62826.1 polysaccharide deacetylase [Atopobacter sp. AH10]
MLRPEKKKTLILCCFVLLFVSLVASLPYFYKTFENGFVNQVSSKKRDNRPIKKLIYKDMIQSKEGEKAKKITPEALMPNRNHNYQALSYAYSAKWVNEVLQGKKHITGKKLVFLTFDDGPNNVITPKILDKLKKEKVPATFFTVGKEIGKEKRSILKREIKEGHAIALHSFTHDYHQLYPERKGNKDVIIKEVKANQDALKKQLGDHFHSSVFRYPGGHMSWKDLEESDQLLSEEGIQWIDWNAANGDALDDSQAPKTKDDMITFHKKTLNYFPDRGIRVILMHDAVGKKLTLEALDAIISYYKQEGYIFAVLH